ncbi:MAG: oxidoreductase, partial [Planctomycetota bacterium]
MNEHVSRPLGIATLARRLALVLLLLGLAPSAAWSQFGISGLPPARFIAVPRTMQQYLRDAERSIQEKQYSDAVVRLGDLLAREGAGDESEDFTGQDYFLNTRFSAKPVSQSLMRTARTRLGQLPSEALETYQVRYGPQARKALTDAIPSRDWFAVESVRRRFFHTTAGFEASYLLAQREMLLGHPLAASMLLD